MKILLLMFTVGFSLCGCTRLADQGFDHMKLAADVDRGVAIDLAHYTPFAWDRVYFFGPYTPETLIEEEVGSSVSFPHRDSESHCLLVFVRRGKVVAACEKRRDQGDFAGLFLKGGYSRGEAVFTTRLREPGGWRYLEKEKAAIH